YPKEAHIVSFAKLCTKSAEVDSDEVINRSVTKTRAERLFHLPHLSHLSFDGSFCFKIREFVSLSNVPVDPPCLSANLSRIQEIGDLRFLDGSSVQCLNFTLQPQDRSR